MKKSNQEVIIKRSDSANTIIYIPFKELISLFLLTFFISILIAASVFASVETLTYDDTTNQLNMSYDSLNRILNKSSATENITYTYDDEYYGTLTNVTIDEDSYEYEYDDRLRVTKEIRTY